MLENAKCVVFDRDIVAFLILAKDPPIKPLTMQIRVQNTVRQAAKPIYVGEEIL
jgi:hypothetical protein